MTDDPKIMHPELAAFFATHESRTSQVKADAHAQIGAVMDAVHAVRLHVMDLEHGLRKAMTVPHDHSIDHNLNSLRARIRSTATAFDAALQQLESAAATVVELEDGFSESTRGLNGLAAVRAANAPPTEATRCLT